MKSVYVITSCLNAQTTINETIASVIGQGGDFRLHYHIQDAASTDGTIQILENWKYLLDNKLYPIACYEVSFSYTSEPDQGMYDGIQKGYARFSISEDSFMTWINADDILMPHSLASILAVEKDIPKVRWISGSHSTLRENNAIEQPQKGVFFPQELIAEGFAEYRAYTFIQQEGTFWKTSLFEEVGGVNAQLKYAGDYDLWMRMAKLEPLWAYPAVLACFRKREGQLSSNLKKYTEEMDKIVDYERKIEKWQEYRNRVQMSNNLVEYASVIEYDYNRNIFIESNPIANVPVQSQLAAEQLGGSKVNKKGSHSLKEIIKSYRDRFFSPVSRMHFDIKRDISDLKKALVQHGNASVALLDSQTEAYEFSMEEGLRRLAAYISKTGTVIDVGASDGHWTRMAIEHFPDYQYFLIEGNKAHEEMLLSLKKENIRYKIAAAGDAVGEINFYTSEDLYAGGASYNAFESGSNRIVPMGTIDGWIEEYQLKQPYIIKLDVHGFEIPILKGAERALQYTDALIIEVYTFNLSEDSLTFPDMCKYLDTKGFRCVGLADPINRKADNALWQMDLFFIRKNHKLFDSNSYQ